MTMNNLDIVERGASHEVEKLCAEIRELRRQLAASQEHGKLQQRAKNACYGVMVGDGTSVEYAEEEYAIACQAEHAAKGLADDLHAPDDLHWPTSEGYWWCETEKYGVLGIITFRIAPGQPWYDGIYVNGWHCNSKITFSNVYGRSRFIRLDATCPFGELAEPFVRDPLTRPEPRRELHPADIFA